jgi:hypothetical protein
MNASQKDWLEASQRHGMELIGPLLSNPLLDAYVCALIDHNIRIMLYMKFMWPAELLKANDELGEFLGRFSLNGIKSSNLCKPY